MNRLRKLALIGNINKDDVDFVNSGDKISLVLKNKDKKPNESAPNEIGFIKYRIDELRVSQSVRIFVDLLFVDDNYRDSRAAMMILNYFEDNIIEPLISQYGKDGVSIAAQFENKKLVEVVKNYGRKKGLKVVDTYDEAEQMKTDPESMHEQVYEMLKREGFNIDEQGMITNSSITKYLRAVNDAADEFTVILDNDNNFVGVITNNGDIVYCDGSLTPSVSGIQFDYDESNHYVTIQSTLADFKNINNKENLFSNLKTVFEGIPIELDGEDYFVDQLIDQLGNELGQFSQLQQTSIVKRINKLRHS